MNRSSACTLRTVVDLPLPFWRCAGYSLDSPGAFLLDSGMDSVRLGRYSYLGGRPAARLTGKRSGPGHRTMDLELTTWRSPDGAEPAAPDVRRFTADPFNALRELRAAYPRDPAVPADSAPGSPLVSGLVGVFGYETAYAIEDLPDTGRDDLGLPDLVFLMVDEVLVHDHASGITTLQVTGRGPEAAIQAAERTTAWLAGFSAWAAGMSKQPPVAPIDGPTASPPVRAHFDRTAYMDAVQRCREHILAGDVFEVCLTHRLAMDLPGSPWALYGALRAINPAPFAAFLQVDDFAVVCASPERFLSLDIDGVAESRPIKGTRPRGATPAADTRLREELATAEKDLAENIMIVDLVRNDFGRVCRVGSVDVPELQVVETYATVHQLVSTVRGVLKPEHDALDLVRACFPGGSMTGAPKIEAMKIIDAIEPVKRGLYSGALGFLDAGGAMDLGMVIRTIVCQDGVATFGVGGAVVADSDPGAEYDETMDKARALIAAVAALHEGGGR